MNIETTFNLLGSSVRRSVISVLRESNSVARDRLAAKLATPEASEDPEEARRRVRIELHHNHLPRLADADLITYDEETVTATGRLETVARQFQGLDSDEATPAPV